MVERQMKWHRLAVGIVAAMCSFAALSQGLAYINDTSADAETNNDMVLPSSASTRQLSATIDVTATDHAPTGNPLWGVPIQSLHATRERPLFSPSRRPPMAAVISPPIEVKAPPPPPPSKPALDLLGIVEGNGEGYAVFINTTTHDIVRLKTGEGEDGWVLRSVSGRQAVLERNHQTEVLELPPLTGVPK
jgi:hypothetical protein